MKPRIVSALVVVALLAAGCGARETAQPTPSDAASLTIRAVDCHTLAQCRAYVSWNRIGDAPSAEERLDGGGEPRSAGWPTPLEPGTYVIHVRWVMVSDAIVNGVADETTVATCDEQVLVQGIHVAEQIDLLIRLDDGGCVITQTASTVDS